MSAIWAVSAVALSAADISVAVPGFQGAGVPGEKRDFFVEYFSERLAAGGGLAVTSAAQIAAVIGAERQRQLLGCGESSNSCSAELAGALGADVIVIGTIAKIGDETAITLKAVDGRNSALLASMSAREVREEKLLDFLGNAAAELRASLLLKLRQVDVAASAPSRLGPAVWVPAAVGVAAGAASLGLFLSAKGIEGRLRSGDPSVGDRSAAVELAQSGNTQQVVSMVLLGVGVAALATAVALYFIAPGRPHQEVKVAWLDFVLPQASWAVTR